VGKVATEINKENQLCLIEQEIPSHQACLASCHLASSGASQYLFMSVDEAALESVEIKVAHNSNPFCSFVSLMLNYVSTQI
jgi:hypothetical protein